MYIVIWDDICGCSCFILFIHQKSGPTNAVSTERWPDNVWIQQTKQFLFLCSTNNNNTSPRFMKSQVASLRVHKWPLRTWMKYQLIPMDIIVLSFNRLPAGFFLTVKCCGVLCIWKCQRRILQKCDRSLELVLHHSNTHFTVKGPLCNQQVWLADWCARNTNWKLPRASRTIRAMLSTFNSEVCPTMLLSSKCAQDRVTPQVSALWEPFSCD